MKIFKFLFSGWFMGILLVVFAYAIGYATFVENDHGAVAAKIIVYNTTWFEVILFLMIINFSGMIFTKHLYLRGKWNILLIHLALIIIIIGAGVTRYFSYEGQMHIREGQSTNIFRSADTYLQIHLKEGEEFKSIDEKFLLASGVSGLFKKEFNWQSKSFKLTVDKYYPSMQEVLVKTDSGPAYLSIVIGSKSGRIDFGLGGGESKVIDDIGISFNDTTNTEFIQIINKGDSLFMRIPQFMTGESQTDSKTGVFKPIQSMAVLRAGNTSFLIKKFVESGFMQYEETKDKSIPGIAVVKVRINDEELMIPKNKPYSLELGNTKVTITIGNRFFQIPFSLKLNKFDLERYPGSNSPSSFASEITVIDEANNVEMPYRIYMNHILNYGGYRFFQSSYDNDEKGTILSLNHDYWGTLITYIGYFLLFASLIASLFIRHNRFYRITQQLKDVHIKRKKLSTAVLILLLVFANTQNLIAQTNNIENHAEKFGQLFVQNQAGRIEPVNTYANKVLVKISKKSTYNNLSADVVLLGIITDQEKWQNEPFIKVADPEVQSLLGLTGDYASFNDFIDEKGYYKIGRQVENAQVTKPALRSTFDKALKC